MLLQVSHCRRLDESGIEAGGWLPESSRQSAPRHPGVWGVNGDDSIRLTGDIPRPISPPTVIAPESLMPLDWIIDYEEANHQTLFAMGRADAERALQRR